MSSSGRRCRTCLDGGLGRLRSHLDSRLDCLGGFESVDALCQVFFSSHEIAPVVGGRGV